MKWHYWSISRLCASGFRHKTWGEAQGQPLVTHSHSSDRLSLLPWAHAHTYLMSLQIHMNMLYDYFLPVCDYRKKKNCPIADRKKILQHLIASRDLSMIPNDNIQQPQVKQKPFLTSLSNISYRVLDYDHVWTYLTITNLKSKLFFLTCLHIPT